MVIIHRQQFGLTGFEPALGRTCLTLGAVPVASRVVGNLVLSAGMAMQHMTAQRGTATLLNRRHDLELPQAQMRMLSMSPGRAIGAEDIRDFQCGAHDSRELHGRQNIQWADHFAQYVGGHLCVQRRGIQFLVPEQYLYHADIDLVLQQVCGKTVAPMPISA